MASADDGISWRDVDERYAERRSESVSFSDVLYGFDCPECAHEVASDECDMDPDGPRWLFECRECDLRFSMYPVEVKIDQYSIE